MRDSILKPAQLLRRRIEPSARPIDPGALFERLLHLGSKRGDSLRATSRLR